MVHRQQLRVPSLPSVHPCEYQSKPAPFAIGGAENRRQEVVRRQWLPKPFCLGIPTAYFLTPSDGYWQTMYNPTGRFITIRWQRWFEVLFRLDSQELQRFLAHKLGFDHAHGLGLVFKTQQPL